MRVLSSADVLAFDLTKLMAQLGVHGPPGSAFTPQPQQHRSALCQPHFRVCAIAVPFMRTKYLCVVMVSGCASQPYRVRLSDVGNPSTEAKLGVDVSADKALIEAAALAYCRQKGAESTDAGSPAHCLNISSNYGHEMQVALLGLFDLAGLTEPYSPYIQMHL